MTTKRKWPAISQVFTSNGGTGGIVIVDDTFGFFIDQKITIDSTAQPKLNLIVREVLSKTQIKVEKKATNNIKNLTIDLLAYLVADTATIAAVSQKMPTKTAEDIIQEAFERGPTDAYRVINVDRLGNPITTENPLQVELSDGSINIGTVNAELEVQLSHQDNVPDAGDIHDSVRIGDGINKLKINTEGSINVHEFFINVQRGLVPGMSAIVKNGQNKTVPVSGEDIWNNPDNVAAYP